MNPSERRGRTRRVRVAWRKRTIPPRWILVICASSLVRGNVVFEGWMTERSPLATEGFEGI